MSDSLTLVLDGTVTLDDLAKAIGEFSGLVTALSKEVAGDKTIEWVITHLQGGSAVATARGIGAPAADVDTVVRAYEKVGEAMERSAPVPFSPTVQKRAHGLLRLIDGRIESIRLETDRRDALIRRGSGSGVVLPFPAQPESSDAFGALEGFVETLSRRGGLRFSLYDILSDKAVSCYLAPGYEDIMRDVWGRRAVVFGRVHRDRLTGRALSIRQVTSIEKISVGQPGEWRQARGAAPALSELSPEDAVRAARNG